MQALSDEAHEHNSHHTTSALPLPLAGEGSGGLWPPFFGESADPDRIGYEWECRLDRHTGAVTQVYPSVVVAKQHNAILIYALDDLAVRAGLSIGLPLANARAICPELTVFDADEVADRKTLEDIADWCDRFTPLVALDPPHGLYLDITGCAHLFGGERALLQIVCGALTPSRLCRQRRDREYLDLRPDADAPDFRKNRCRWRGGRGRQSAAGIRARRR